MDSSYSPSCRPSPNPSSGRGGATTASGSSSSGRGSGGVMGWLRSLAPGPNADPKRRLDWEFMKIAAPGQW